MEKIFMSSKTKQKARKNLDNRNLKNNKHKKFNPVINDDEAVRPDMTGFYIEMEEHFQKNPEEVARLREWEAENKKAAEEKEIEEALKKDHVYDCGGDLSQDEIDAVLEGRIEFDEFEKNFKKQNPEYTGYHPHLPSYLIFKQVQSGEYKGYEYERVPCPAKKTQESTIDEK